MNNDLCSISCKTSIPVPAQNITSISCKTSIPVPAQNITIDLATLHNTLSSIEEFTESILSKINGGHEGCTGGSKEPACISDMLADLKGTADIINAKLDRINSMM